MSETQQPGAGEEKGILDEISDSLAQLPDKGLFAILFLAWVGLFQFLGNSTLGYVETRSLFGWLKYCYDMSVDDEHGYLIPFVVLALFWWKKKELLEVPKYVWWPALGIVALALFLHIGGYIVQQTRISAVAFAVGLYGLMGAVWGFRWLQATFFPMILLAFCVPLGTLADFITFPLRILVTTISVGIGHEILGVDIFRNGSQILSGAGKPLYDVAPACSGIRSLVTMLAMTTIYGFTSFQKPWKRLLILVMAAPVAVAGNVARITTVIIVGEAFGQDAGLMVEQKLGFVTFAVAIGLVLALGYLIREKEPVGKSNSSSEVRSLEAKTA